VKLGQRINLTLHDYAAGLRERPSNQGGVDYCYKYGTISEGTSRRKDKSMCGGTEAVKTIYVSDTHQIDITINQALADRETPNYFVLKYEG
jgi:hypothetical protein